MFPNPVTIHPKCKMMLMMMNGTPRATTTNPKSKLGDNGVEVGALANGDTPGVKLTKAGIALGGLRSPAMGSTVTVDGKAGMDGQRHLRALAQQREAVRIETLKIRILGVVSFQEVIRVAFKRVLKSVDGLLPLMHKGKISEEDQLKADAGLLRGWSHRASPGMPEIKEMTSGPQRGPISGKSPLGDA